MAIFWAGDAESFQLVLQAQARVEALQAQPGMSAGRIDEMLAALPPIWRHEGSTAVVDISGPVVQGDAGWLRLFGVLGYDNIAQAAVDAVSHVDTKKVLYHINSPGGDVAGIFDIGARLSALSGAKPSAVHTTELMASAGYWMASAIQGDITAGPTAIVGSIGVLQVHSERSKQLEQDGIKVTVLRSGKYKAEINSVEELTPEAKARAESQLADVHGMFRAAVAKGRPNLSAQDLADVTEGETFLGKRAVGAGLVDRVASFGQALKLLDNKKSPGNTSTNSKGQAMFTPEQIQALLASGATLAGLGIKADGSVMTEDEKTAALAADAKVAADAKAAADAKTVADEAAAKAAADAAAKPAETAVDLLKAQLVAKDAALITAQAELISLKATTQTQAEQHTGLLAIARVAVSNMLVPMGASDSAVAGMDAAGIIAEHARVKPLFIEKFKPGQQSASVAASAPKKIPSDFLARVNAQTKSK